MIFFYALVLLLPSQELGSYYGTGLTVSMSHYEEIEPATHSKIRNKNALEHIVHSVCKANSQIFTIPPSLALHFQLLTYKCFKPLNRRSHSQKL